MSLPLCIESQRTGDLALRVEFVWERDRYRHLIALAHRDGSAEPCLESVEGNADDAWPASPPLQSLSIETLADGRRVALLVGMAGGSHWSASIEPAIDSASLVFDIACRTAGEAAALGSQYAPAAAGSAFLFHAPDGSWCRITFREIDVTVVPLHSAASPTRLAAVDGERLTIAPAEANLQPVRWRYEVLLGQV
jgi:hypothetical protein